MNQANKRGLFTQSVVFDPETREQLATLAKDHDRTNSGLIRWLIRQEYIRRYSPESGRPAPHQSQEFNQ
jgi:hypothetical protein